MSGGTPSPTPAFNVTADDVEGSYANYTKCSIPTHPNWASGGYYGTPDSLFDAPS